jgi:hypothetical protein
MYHGEKANIFSYRIWFQMRKTKELVAHVQDGPLLPARGGGSVPRSARGSRLHSSAVLRHYRYG